MKTLYKLNLEDKKYKQRSRNKVFSPCVVFVPFPTMPRRRACVFFASQIGKDTSAAVALQGTKEEQNTKCSLKTTNTLTFWAGGLSLPTAYNRCVYLRVSGNREKTKTNINLHPSNINLHRMCYNK